MKRIIVVGVALSATLTLAACGPKAKVAAAPSASASAVASGVPAGASPSPSAPSPSASASGSASPSKQDQAPPSAGPGGGSPGFTAALAEWKKGATASSAEQGAFWTRAAADLTSGLKTDKARTDEYSFAIAALKALVKLPSGQQSSGQNMEFHIDVEALNSFFGTPGLYS
jgi:hypothetical protein